MALRDMIATAAFTYKTRRLKAGDGFQAPERDARVLIAIKKAEEGRVAGRISPPPAGTAEKMKRRTDESRSQLDHDENGRAGGSRSASGDLTALRAEYTEVVGKKPFNGWDADTLREKIAAAK